MNIGILIICTGKYIVFFEELYKSCEQYFLPGMKKTYYVFTESELPQTDNIVKINQGFIGWPFDTMYRFKFFNSIKDLLEKEDYLFFFNANMKCVNEVETNILPNEEQNYLVGVHHPGFYNRPPDEFTYERNPNSNFYIPFGKGDYYCQGNFNGGRSLEYLKMSEKLEELIDNDLSKGITPVWHDESALNWYLMYNKPLLLGVEYSSPEGWGIPNSKIMNRDKNKFGGYNNLRTKL